MHELDRILDRQDMALDALVDVVDHGGQRGRFAGAGLAGHQDQPVIGPAQRAHRFGQIELTERQRLRGYRPQHRPHAIELPHDIDAKAALAFERVGEVGAVFEFEAIDRLLRHDLIQGDLDQVRGQYFRAQWRKLPVQAYTRRIAGDEVQVRAAPAHAFFQQLIDLCLLY